MVELYNGDCLDVLPSVQMSRVGLILADLPYGVTNRNQWDAVIPFGPLWAQYNRTSNVVPVILTATQPFASACVLSNPSAFKYEWIWNKSKVTGVLNAKRQPLRNHEQVLVFYRAQPTYNPQGLTACHKVLTDKGSSLNYGAKKGEAYEQTQTGYPRSVLAIGSEGRTVHPTQKPVALMDYLIRTYTKPGDVVMDNTMGGGTTGVAAVLAGRSFIGIEKDPTYFAIAQRRISEAQQQMEALAA